MQANLLTLKQIIENPHLVTETIDLVKIDGSEKILFRPLLCNDVFALQQFLESLSERTRRFATHPSYDLKCARQYCNEIGQDNILRIVAISESEKMIALFELNFHIVQFDIERYQKYDIELNSKHDIQLAPCISDEYQNQRLGTQLLHRIINLARRLCKNRIIAWAGVLSDNDQAIRFYEKNNFKVFRQKYIAEDGYECYDAIL